MGRQTGGAGAGRRAGKRFSCQEHNSKTIQNILMILNRSTAMIKWGAAECHIKE